MKYTLKKIFHIGNVPYRYDQLFREIRVRRPMQILEIGVWTGERARKMIELAARYHPLSDVHYHGFDLFETMDEDKFLKEISKQPPSIEEVRQKLDLTRAHIHLYKGDTLDTLPQAISSLPPIDIAFIDGGHSLETIANDWYWVSQKLRSGSVVVFDDYWADRLDAGAKVTVDAIDRDEYNVDILPTKDSFKNTPFGPLTIQLARVVKR